MKPKGAREINLGSGVTINLFQGIRLHVWPDEQGEAHFSISREATFLRRNEAAKKQAGRPPSAALVKLRGKLANVAPPLGKDQFAALVAEYALVAGTSKKVAAHAVRRELARRAPSPSLAMARRRGRPPSLAAHLAKAWAELDDGPADPSSCARWLASATVVRLATAQQTVRRALQAK